MALILNLIEKYNKSKKFDTPSLFYGFVGYEQAVTEATPASSRFKFNTEDGLYVMQMLTERERDTYLNHTHHTFWDSNCCELEKYLAVKNSNIQFVRIPSLNNKIVACSGLMANTSLIAPCEVCGRLQPLALAVDNLDERLSLEQIKQIEQKLNTNHEKYYFSR